jgi:hypothetical protein
MDSSACASGPGGVVYGATGFCLFRIKPGTCEVERVWQLDVPPKQRPAPCGSPPSRPIPSTSLGPIVGHKLYFATGWRLRVLTLP